MKTCAFFSRFFKVSRVGILARFFQGSLGNMRNPQTKLMGKESTPKQQLRNDFQRGKMSVATVPVFWEITAALNSAVMPHVVPINHAFEKQKIGTIFVPAVFTVRTSPSGVWSSCQKRQAFAPHAFTLNLIEHGKLGSSASLTKGWYEAFGACSFRASRKYASKASNVTRASSFKCRSRFCRVSTALSF